MAAFDSNSLPSKTIPYAIKAIEMSPFKVAQVMQLSRAVALQSMKPTVEALDSVMDFDANDLTDGDFYYLLAWQRIHAYSHSPLKAAWECEGMVFQEEGNLERVFTQDQIKALVEEYDAASEEEKALLENPEELKVTSRLCRHFNSVDILMDHLRVVYLEDGVKLDPRLDFPRVRTLADSLARTDNPDQQNIVQAARWVRDGNTLDDKLAILQAEPNLELFEKALQANALVRHGISRTVTLKCEQCNEESAHAFDIRPETFFDV